MQLYLYATTSTPLVTPSGAKLAHKNCVARARGKPIECRVFAFKGQGGRGGRGGRGRTHFFAHGHIDCIRKGEIRELDVVV